MPTTHVHIFSLEHLLPIFVAVCILFLMLILVKGKSQKFKHNLVHGLALVISLVLISYHAYNMVIGNYSYTQDLPLYLCSFMALIIPFFTYYRKYWMFEILVFWIIAGTLQGVVTPDISVGFPSFDYFRYWFVHLGLLVVISYVIIVLKMRPTFKSVLKSYLVFQGYIIVMLGLNYILDSNYGYLNRKPESISVLDVLGNWPVYVIKADVILLVVFLIIYFFFFLYQKKRASN